jgi:hypothetical protein
MKFMLGVAILFFMSGPILAATTAPNSSKVRFADATSDACFANCASQDASCKRVCPTTLSTPCLSSCDSQAQTCKQSCQSSR